MKNKNKRWIILCVIILAIIAFVFVQSKGSSENKDTDAVVKNLYIYSNDDYGLSFYIDESYNKDADLIDTFGCVSKECQIAMSGSVVVVYDNGKVYYKKLDDKKSDYQEITRSRTITYAGPKTEVTIEDYTHLGTESYLITTENVSNKKLYMPYYTEHNDSDNQILFDKKTLEEGIVLYVEQDNDAEEYLRKVYTYNIKTEKTIKDLSGDLDIEEFPYSIYNFYKQDNFYAITTANASSLKATLLYNKEFELLLKESYHKTVTDCDDFSTNKKIDKLDKSQVIVNNIKYIKDNNLYYIDNNILYLKDENNNIKKKFNNMVALSIRESYLLYLDESNLIKIRDLSTDQDVLSSNIKFSKNGYFNFGYSEDTFIIAYEDSTLSKTEGWKTLANDYLKEDSGMCSDINDLQSGYLVEFDKKGNLLSKQQTIITTNCISFD